MYQFIFHILGYDLWFYASHLLLHTRILYEIVHKKHHMNIYPKYYDTYVGHWFEGPFQSIGFLLPWAFMDIEWVPFVAALIFVNARGILRHESRLGWLVGNHHLLHHSMFYCNYGEYWLDRLFNTHCKVEDACKKGLLGL